MNSASGGDIIFHFKGDTSNLDKNIKDTTGGMKGMTKSILAATGVTKVLSAGMNMITNSTDNAIKRIDTFNAFPKVLQNFGVSVDEAQKSMDRIDKSVRGLPTSLDQAVAGVQNIFMVTKDLPKAEAMFKAINDSAMVFANGSTEAVDRFTYAYKQAMSSGKVYAQDFNQMNEAIPGLMDKVAESMGVSFAELKTGLADGSISLDEFNSALKKLDTEGTGSMEALEKVAKTSTGGIATQITNAKTSITRGVAEMIKSIDEGLANAGLGGIGQVITNVAKSLETGLKSFAPIIINVVSFLSDLYNWLQKNKTIITAVVIVLGSMYTTFKLLTIISTITNTIKAFQLGIVALKTTAMLCGGSLSTLRAGMMMLNLTFLTSPIFWIIAAIISLIAVFVLLWNKCEWFRNFWIGLWEGIKSVFQAVIDGIVSIFTGIIDFFANNWTTLLLFLVNPFVGAFKLLYDKCEGFRNFVNGFVQAVIGFFQRLPGNIKQIATTIVNTIKSIPGKVVSIGLDIVKGIGNGITSGVSWIKNKIKEFVGNVTSFIKKVFKIGSPSKLMADQVGQWIPKGIAVGIDANTDSVYDSMKEMQDSISGNFGLSPQLANSLHYSPSVNVVNNVDVSTDPLGQTVNKIKTFSGGAKNDYNYGMGV